MDTLYRVLTDLLTDVSSESRFNDPANRPRIAKTAERLASLAHDLRSLKGADPDPSISLFGSLLATETRRAAREFKRGNRAYARQIFRTIPSYCVACHTRNASGVQFSSLPLEPAKGTLQPLERGEFFAASRQFERAQTELLAVVRAPNASDTGYWAWEQAVRRSLAIAVRVRRDPEQATEIVRSVLDSPNAPRFIKEDALAWLESLQAWKREGTHVANTEEGRRAEALRLMDQARKSQRYPMDRNADILYLRASATVHDFLQAYPRSPYLADMLLLAGLAYEVLAPLKLEDLHGLYYESCVRQAPGTETARLCYMRYEASAFAGYTGSAGTDLPREIKQKLSDLRELSQAKRETRP